jgi:hypothetical protein
MDHDGEDAFNNGNLRAIFTEARIIASIIRRRGTVDQECQRALQALRHFVNRCMIVSDGDCAHYSYLEALLQRVQATGNGKRARKLWVRKIYSIVNVL